MAGAAESAIATDVHLVPPSKPLGRLKEAMSIGVKCIKVHIQRVDVSGKEIFSRRHQIIVCLPELYLSPLQLAGGAI